MISAIFHGFFLALFSCGITLNYRIGKLLNLSYGSFFTLGAYLSLIFPYNTSLALSALAGFSIGYFMYLVISKISRDIIDSTLISLGFGIAIEEILRISFSATHVLLTEVELRYINIFGEEVSIFDLYTFLLSVAFFILLLTVFSGLSGLKLKFVEEDEELAEIYGVNVELLKMLTITCTSSVAALCGAILSPMQAINPSMDWPILISAIVISAISSVFGGVGFKRYAYVLLTSLIYSTILEVIF